MKSILKELMGWIVYIVIIVGLAWLIITFVGQRTQVSGLLHGDDSFRRRSAYRR